MNRWLHILLLFVTVLVLLIAGGASLAQADNPATVRAILFYSPTCPHCHQVIQNDLPPLMDEYGEQLQIVGIDTSQPGGQALYQAAIQYFNIPDHRRGVPTLVVSDVVLVGSGEIPQMFPELIEDYLADGGVDWPAIPGLAEAMTVAEEAEAAEAPPDDLETDTTPEGEAATPVSPVATPDRVEAAGNPSNTSPIATPTEPLATESPVARNPSATPVAAAAPDTASPTPEVDLVALDRQPLEVESLTVWGRVALDPVGNGLAIVVLIGMVVMVAYAGTTLRSGKGASARGWREWIVPLLCLVGFGVAAYLSYVETAQVTAVCGPVGDCNTVQQSPYARLFGLIPIGLLGLVGYIAMFVAWLVGRLGQGIVADLGWLALFVMAFLGTLFSIYLTFLEPFVIGATCAWCLTSAIIMTALLWVSASPARRAISHLSFGTAS